MGCSHDPILVNDASAAEGKAYDGELFRFVSKFVVKASAVILPIGNGEFGSRISIRKDSLTIHGNSPSSALTPSMILVVNLFPHVLSEM